MSNILLDWLNNNVQLSEEIISFDDDFRDGYLLGELLHKYHQQDNFNDFQKKFDPDTRIRNYCLLEPTIRRLGLDFNFKLAFDIMEGKKGVMKALLSELRIVLERIEKNAKPPIAPVGQRGQIMRVMKPGNERFDKSMSAGFEKSVRAHMDNPTEVLLYKTVGAKYDAIGTANIAQAEENTAMDDWQAAYEKSRKREIFENRKKHEAEFHKAWDMLNVEQWKKNQMTSKNRRETLKREKEEYDNKRATHFFNENVDARADTYERIDHFEKRLEKEVFQDDKDMVSTLGLSLTKTVRGGEGTGLPELEYTNQVFLDKGFEISQQKMKEKSKEQKALRQENDRKRMKFVRATEKRMGDKLHDEMQALIVKELLNKSQAEIEEEARHEKAMKLAEVYAENRKARDDLAFKYEEKDAARRQEWQKELGTREVEWTVADHKDSLLNRSDALTTAQSSAENQRSLEFIEDMIDRIIDLTMWTASCRHIGLYHRKSNVPPVVTETTEAEGTEEVQPITTPFDAQNIPADVEEMKELEDKLVPYELWKDAREVFVSGLPMSEALIDPYETNVFQEPPHSLSERPLCVNTDWLLSKTFQTHLVFAVKGTYDKAVLSLEKVSEKEAPSEDQKEERAPSTEEGETEVDAAPVELTEEEKAAKALQDKIDHDPVMPIIGKVSDKNGSVEVPVDRQLTEYLADSDYTRFVELVSNIDIEGYNEVPEGLEIPAVNLPMDTTSEEYQDGVLCAPEWLFTTAPKYILGEALVDTACTSDPLPEDPKPPVDMQDAPVRLALLGVSDQAKKAIATSLQESCPQLRIINTEVLLHNAVQLAEAVKAKTDTDSIVDEMAITMTEDESIAMEVHSHLQSGNTIPDFLYIKLIVQAIHTALPPVKIPLTEEEEIAKMKANNMKTEKKLQEEAEEAAAEEKAIREAHPGFVLEDFPATKQQMVSLLQALSGIDYDTDKPKPADKASSFAKAKPESYNPLKFDAMKCGLNKIIHIEVGDKKKLTNERAATRKNLYTGEDISIEQGLPEGLSMNGIQELYTPLRPFHTCSIDYNVSHQSMEPLLSFSSSLNIVSSYSVGDWEGDFKTLDEAIKVINNETISFCFPNGLPAQEGEVPVAQEEAEAEIAKAEGVVEAEHETEEKKEADEEAAAAAAETPADGEQTVEGGATEPEVEVVMSSPVTVKLQKDVADYLMGVWKSVENSSVYRSRECFASLRDIRYEMLQRRRVIHDIIYKFLVSKDTREKLYLQFREQFNAVNWEMRFDDDFINELNLRSLELGRNMWAMCDERKNEASSCLKKFMSDGDLQVNIHMSQVEGVSLIQAEFERFIAALHVIFDYTKSVSSFDSKLLMRNTMEECLEAIKPTLADIGGADAGGKDAKGKDKGKGGKGAPASADPYRVPYAPILLPTDAMNAIPGPPVEEEEDPKAKGKKDAKKGKGGDDAPEDPLSIMISKALDAVSNWTRDGGFTVQRVLYGDQESLCVAVENAIWYEAERFKYSIDVIKQLVTKQVKWLTDMEHNIGLVMTQIVQDRYEREYKMVHGLVQMIHNVIREAEPIRENWQMSQDSIVVFKNDLVYPAEPVPPVPVIQQFYDNKLNEEQLININQWIDSKTNANGLVLLTDVAIMLERAYNVVGPSANMEWISYKHELRPDQPGGCLQIKGIKCADLINLEASAKSGTSDPFVKFSIGDTVPSIETKYLDNTENPEFPEELAMDWDGETPLTIDVLDHDRGRVHDPLGTFVLDLVAMKDQLVETCDSGAFIPVTDKALENVEKGTISLEISMRAKVLESKFHSVLLNVVLPKKWRNPRANYDKVCEYLMPDPVLPGQAKGYEQTAGYITAEELKKRFTIEIEQIEEKAFTGSV